MSTIQYCSYGLSLNLCKEELIKEYGSSPNEKILLKLDKKNLQWNNIFAIDPF